MEGGKAGQGGWGPDARQRRDSTVQLREEGRVVLVATGREGSTPAQPNILANT